MTGKLFGTSMNEVVGPEQLRGQFVSLNMKNCKWFMSPTQDQRLSMNLDNPTVKIPDTCNREDLECLMLKLKAKHLVIGKTPVEEFTKEPDRLKVHLNMITEHFPEKNVLDHVKVVVNGVNLDGGYNKLEILERMLEAEEINPVTRRGGKNRPKVVAFIREALQYVEEMYGGVSKVTREDFSPAKDGSSLRQYTPANVNSSKAKGFLGITEK